MAKAIVFTKPCTAEFIDFEETAPKAGEVQVRLMCSTVSSGTERANLIGDLNINPKRKLTEAVFPKCMGYSTAGIVEQAGEGVTGFEPGDRVALSWSCNRQLLNISAENVYKIGDDIPFEDAAIFHIASFPLAALRKCKLEIGESALVMGLGILGMCALPLLKAAGAVPVIAADPDPVKREKALKFGADFAFDPFEEGFSDRVKQATNGGVNVAIEVTGNGQALDSVLDCMARFGRIALLGCTRNSDFTIDYYRKIHFPGITLIGAHTMARPAHDSSDGWWTQDGDMNTIIKLTRLGRIKLSDMIDEVHSPENAPTVYSRLANEPVFPLVQFDWRKL